MTKLPHIVESFPLTVENVAKQYTKLPKDVSNVLYHYTTRAGIEGILRDGGLRASYRMTMNDAGEFHYARNLVYEVLEELGRCKELPKVAKSLAKLTRINLEQYLKDTTELCRAYCACLTVCADHPDQWRNFGEAGKGFAIGFSFPQLVNAQIPKVLNQQSSLVFAPVTYEEYKQRNIVRQFVRAGICDFQNFAESRSRRRENLTAIGTRITKEIIVHLFVMIDFLKAPEYIAEREIRLILDPNNGTIKASNIQFIERNGELIPYLFMDLRNPNTGRLPLVEIKIGPKSRYDQDLAFAERLLDEWGYGSGGFADRPRIVQSKLRDGQSEGW